MIIKDEGTDPGKARVTFRLPKSLRADSVHVMGDFDGNHHAHPLTRQNGDTSWRVTFELEKDRNYQFYYLIKSGDAEIQTVTEQFQL
ncbi:MAG: hypothetical protein R6V13_05895 [Anaerolineae bacterium]